MLGVLDSHTTIEQLNSQSSLEGYAATRPDGLLRPQADNANGQQLVANSSKSIIITSSVAGLYGGKCFR